MPIWRIRVRASIVCRASKRYHGFWLTPGNNRFPDCLRWSPSSIGPLASFACDEDWVEHPYREGVTLIGDAAAPPTPCMVKAWP